MNCHVSAVGGHDLPNASPRIQTPDTAMKRRKGKKPSALPPSLPPRGLSREQAAEYVGVSESHFDTMVNEGLMPKPKRSGKRTIWDLLAVDQAFSRLPNEDEQNPWDE